MDIIMNKYNSGWYNRGQYNSDVGLKTTIPKYNISRLEIGI